MDFVDVVEVVSAVLRQLKSRSYVESGIINRTIHDIEAVTRDLGCYQFYSDTSDKFKELLENLLAAAYKLEDFAETFTLSRKPRLIRRLGFGGRSIFVLGQMLDLKARVEFANEIKKIILEINNVIKKLGKHEREKSDVVGLQEGKGVIVTWLTDNCSVPHLAFVLISGQTGYGKTTLAKEIYESVNIKFESGSGKTTLPTEIYESPDIKFEFCAWVSASDDPVSNLRKILQEITENSTVNLQEYTAEELEEEICKKLREKRWLLVIDNVPSPYLFRTKSGSALSDEGCLSRVIMTMSSKYLIDRFRDEYPPNRRLIYELEPLQDEDAWRLFLKKVRPHNVESDFSEMLKRKIINICEGIPSAILVLGHFLSKKKCSEWLADYHLDQYPTDDGNKVSVSRLSKILALMNSDLTFGLRPCLFYFALFPKGDEIPVRRLLRLWVAEGLIATDHQNPEETAERILTYFIIKGIVEIVKLRKDGDPKTCRFPGIVHDICLSKADDIGLRLHIGRTNASSRPKFGVRGLAEHGDIKDYPREDEYIQHLRSYLSFSMQNKDTPAVEVGKFLSQVIDHRGFGLLRVLDLERVYKPKLPENLGKLYHLRYLGLRWTFLDTLPHSVSKLPYLETLDVKHTYISSLPNSIWKMLHLRHLWVNETRLDMPVKKHSISLTGLQTLWGLFVDNKTPVKKGLDKLTELRKLGLTFHLDSVGELNEWIAGLKGLQSLRLRSKDRNGQPSKLEISDTLSGLENLTDLYLLGNLPGLHDNYFPHSIIVLTLSVSMLEEDPMPILAKLTNLSVLGLLANSYIGKEMMCPHEGFPKLRIVKFWMLNTLETWTVEEGAMPGLNELEIRCCHNLKELPDKLLNQSKIEKIILTNMEEDFVDNIRTKIPDREILVSDQQQIWPVRCTSCKDYMKQVRGLSGHSSICIQEEISSFVLKPLKTA